LDPDTAIGGPHGHFPSTQISLLEAAAAGLSSDALDRVIALYWKPVYRFIRLKFRKNNEDAKDLTQGFFAVALQRDFFARFDPAKASFRTYLRMAVERFAANQHAALNRQKRGGDIEFETDAEQVAATETPEQVFEREWQRQLFCLALDDLRAYCNGIGKELQFRVFQDYDLAAGERPSYAELAVRHGISENSVTNYLAWARRMLLGFATERLRGTTSGARELREEMRRVWI
jgi:RNA polymerase sigma factor (sigma-70 family)